MTRLFLISTGVLLGVAGAAHAQPTVSAPPPTSSPGEPPPPTVAPKTDDHEKTEFNIVPLVGGNSDIGIGAGQLSNISGVKQGIEPFRWQLETSAFISFKPQHGSLIVPLQDYWVAFHLPYQGPRRVRIDARAAYTDERALPFYGIGNASTVPKDIPVEQTQFARIHPTLLLRARMPVYRDVYVTAGDVFTYNRFTVAPTSVLGQYAATGPADGRKFVGSFAPHSVELAEVGAQYDTRDHQIDTRSGQFHEIQFRLSPKLGSALPYDYERITATTRGYYPVNDRITLSARLVGDVMLGDVPFYELARYDETPAIGGLNAVRGVPANRYYGKVKLFGNLEARSDLFNFHFLGKPLKLGIAAFFDGGRSWTELLHSHPDLDGTGIGLKYGIGGGLRLQQNTTFVLRFDLAYSPDATPVGAYFTAGQIF